MAKNRRRIPLPEPEIEPVAEDFPQEEPLEETPQEEPQAEEEPVSNRLSDKIKKIVSELPTQKTRRMAGFLCLFAGVFFALAFISHFFYWWMDYDVVQQMRSGSIWADSGWHVRNLGGRLGAYLADVFINKGFGIASFLFPLILLLIGLQLLNLRKYAWIKLIFRSLFGLLWISVLLGWFCGTGRFYVFGGHAGIFAGNYLRGLIGNPGLGFLLAFTLICYLILNYNLRNVRISFRKSPKSKPEEDKTEEYEPEAPSDTPKPILSDNSDLPLHINDDAGFGMTLSTRIRIPEPVQTETPASEPASAENMEAVPSQPQTFRLTLDDEPEEAPIPPASPVAEETPQEPENEEGTPNDEEHPEDEMVVLDTRVVEQKPADTATRPDHFGLDTPFDPRLELSGFRFPTLDLLEDFGDQSQKIQDM
ncbi:MAG: DNA translocase FtsK 4TM domain-containing protein, partial [Bacteroidales bacterium]|nr:DNA translocase FtsK 4TM domain-containing protein [Bacteroidales bacterium]